MESLKDADRKLAAQGLFRKAIKADGNCFFRAISDQVTGFEDIRYKEYRATAASYFISNSEIFLDYLVGRDVKTYHELMVKDGNHADSTEIAALAKANNYEISVHSIDEVIVFPPVNLTVGTLRLKVFYTGDGINGHYESICSTLEDFDVSKRWHRIRSETDEITCTLSQNQKPVMSANVVEKLRKELIKPFKCRKCDMCFTRNCDRTRHELIHADDKPHVCTKCSKSFTRKSDLKRHLMIHTSEKPFKCPVCEYSSNHKSHVNRHFKGHHVHKISTEKATEENVIHATDTICPICNKRFNRKADMKRHQVVHTGEKPHICPVCKKSFNQKAVLVRHLSLHTGEKSHICPVCNMFFTLKSDLEKHHVIHTRQKRFKCTVCDYSSTYKAHVKRHITRMHTRKTSNTNCETQNNSNQITTGFKTSSSMDEVKFSPEIINRNFVNTEDKSVVLCTVSELESSRLDTSPQEIVKYVVYGDGCPTLGTKEGLPDKLQSSPILVNDKENAVIDQNHSGSSTNSQILRQSSGTHSNQSEMDIYNKTKTLKKFRISKIGPSKTKNSVLKRYKCILCPANFINHFNMKRHRKKHAKKLMYKCNVCESSFSQKSVLARHRKSHNKKPISKKCEVERHVVTYIEENSNKCRKCELTFSTVGELNSHLVMHLDENAYNCVFCTQSFDFKWDLLNHKKTTHPLGKNNFSCPTCPKSFYTEDSLKLHNMIHTGLFPFKCIECPCAFRRNWDLQQHMLFHSEDRRFKCRNCTCSFIRQSDLTAHYKRVHPSTNIYFCRNCKMRFDTRKDLRIHFKIHIIEKPHQCDVCRKTFRLKTTLNYHKKIHPRRKIDQKNYYGNSIRQQTRPVRIVITEQRENATKGDGTGHNTTRVIFQCYFCSKTFKNEIRLNIHIRSHTKEKPFKCSNCLKRFYSKAARDVHVRFKSGYKPYKCSKCGLSFVKREEFVYHRRRNCLQDFNKHPVGKTDTHSLNTTPLMFFKNCFNEYICRTIAPDEDLDGLYNSYYTPWGIKDDSSKGVAVGFTTLNDITKASKNIFYRIRTGIVECCSYRNQYHEDEWVPLHEDSMHFGIYCLTYAVANKIKWYLRLRIDSMGTLHPHEPIKEFHPHAQLIENIVMGYRQVFPQPIQRWLTHSSAEMAAHILDINIRVPALNKSHKLEFLNAEAKLTNESQRQGVDDVGI